MAQEELTVSDYLFGLGLLALLVGGGYGIYWAYQQYLWLGAVGALVVILIAFFCLVAMTDWIADDDKGKGDDEEVEIATINGQGETVSYTLTKGRHDARALLKKATALHGEKHYLAAVECLKAAYDLMWDEETIWPVSTYLRLPLYLQKAGKYEEALEEFRDMLEDANVTVNREFKHLSPAKRKSHVVFRRHAIYDKMRVAAQREKRTADALYFDLMARQLKKLALKMQNRKAAHADLESIFADEKLLKKIERLKVDGLLAHLQHACDEFDAAGRQADQAILSRQLLDALGLTYYRAYHAGE